MPQVADVWSVHWFIGSCPAGIALHAPSAPAIPHDRHVPVHAVAQQYPCSQNPVTHSEAAAATTDRTYRLRPDGLVPVALDASMKSRI